MANRPTRLAMVIQFPVHYHLTIYRELAKDPDIDLEVLFMQERWAESGFDPEVNAIVDWGVQPFEGYPWTIFKNLSPFRNGGGFFKFFNPGMVWRVFTGKYDAIYIHGHNHLTHVLCMIAARLSGKALVMRNISNNLGQRASWKSVVRKMLYTMLYKLPNVFLSTGRHNSDYYQYFGADPSKFIVAPHVVDNQFFKQSEESNLPLKEDLRQEYGVPAGKKVMLFLSKFREIKRPILIVEAFLKADLPEDWVLLMVGEGELRSETKRYVDEQGASDRVLFSGFHDQTEVGRAYTISDILVLFTRRETWGLVINEAMNFGCAIIASDQVGCVPELVEDKSGLVVKWDDPVALQNAMKELTENPVLLQKCQAAARDVIRTWDVDAYVRSMHQALTKTIKQ